MLMFSLSSFIACRRRRPSREIYQPENLGYPLVRSNSAPNSPTQKLATIQRHATLEGPHHHPHRGGGPFTPCMERAYHPMTRTLRTTASRDGKYTHVWELRHQPQCTVAAAAVMPTTHIPECQQQLLQDHQQQQLQQQPNVVPLQHHILQQQQQQPCEEEQQEPDPHQQQQQGGDDGASMDSLHRCTCGQQPPMEGDDQDMPPPPKMCAEPDVILQDGSCMPRSFSTFKPVRSEHIYESPKFETFKAGGKQQRRPTVFFELDAKKQNRKNETVAQGST